MHEYITTLELSQRIKLAEGTIRNMVCQGIFVKGVHYVKPSSRKLLFLWQEVESWLHRDDPHDGGEAREKERSLIRTGRG